MRRYSLGPSPSFIQSSRVDLRLFGSAKQQNGGEALAARQSDRHPRDAIGLHRRHLRSRNALSQYGAFPAEAVSALMTTSDAPLAVFGFLTDFDLAGGEFIGIGA